jgi:hypothetical protein
VTVYDEVTSVVEVVHDCHAVEVEVSSMGTTVSEVKTVEVFLPIGQLVISGAQEVMVYTLVSVRAEVDDD